jgi:hypothetical protein
MSSLVSSNPNPRSPNEKGRTRAINSDPAKA